MIDDRPSDGRVRWSRLPWLAFGVAMVPFALLVWRFDFVCDDAFITFRYARNLARGLGLVYNPGVQPPVEGYSELLWALFVAGGMKLGIAPMVTSRVLSIAAGVLLVSVTTGLLARRVAKTTLATLGAALFLGCLAPLAVWTTGGMATMPFAAAVVGLFALLWSDERPAAAWKLGGVASVVVLLRADGAWWVAWLLGPALVSGLLRRERARWLPVLVGASSSAAVFLAHVAWRLSTYGDWVPNTARAKVGFSVAAAERGADYVGHFLLVFPGVALALLLGLLAWRGREARTVPLLVAALVTLLYAVLVGGDFMAFGRFLVPALPFVALLLGVGLARLESAGARGGAALLAAACVGTVLPPVFGGAVTPASWRQALSVRRNANQPFERSELEQWRLMDGQAKEWRDLGIALGLVARPGDSVVHGAIGAIGYYSDLFVHDCNGLVTREVALREAPEELGSPGHDKRVSPDFFAPLHPTFVDAFFYPGTVDQLRRDPRVGWGMRPLEVVELDPARNPRPDMLFVVQRGDR